MGKDKSRKTISGKSLNTAFFLIGIFIVLIGNLPFLILKGDSVIPVRDQLDGELVGYILGARYLFSGVNYYPEFLGGVNKMSLIPPSYGTLLFYKLLPPIYAFIVNQLFVMLVGFCGMYLWGVKLTEKRFFSFLGALLFAFLPYFTVYGLSVSGVPLVAWALYVLLDSHEKKAREYVYAYLSLALYAFFSSFVLCGYAVCAVSAAAFIVILIKRKNISDTAGKVRMAIGISELILIYILLNRELVFSLFGQGEGFVSHKQEIVPTSSEFLSTFIELITDGSKAVPSLHKFIFIEAVFTIALAIGYAFVIRKKDVKDNSAETGGIKSLSMILIVLVGAAVVTALFSAILHIEPVASALGRTSGVLKAFQIDRFYWLYPFIWYTILIVICAIISRIFNKSKWWNLIYVLIFLPCAVLVLQKSPFKENAMEFVRKESTALTWNAFFSEEEFRQVADYIEAETGMKQSEYRVGSLGIEPSISFYNGFYTIDGYSNNYDLNYKHRFRKVIAAELEKNEYNKDYFDNWGNRCYLFSSEYYGNPLLSKYEHPAFTDLELDTEALKELGCKYIISAGEIVGAEDKNFKLLNIFDEYRYTYVVYLYEVL